MSKIRVGIVGCGEVVQIIHLPALHQLRELFEVTALCDVSRKVLDAVAAHCGNAPSLYGSHEALVLDPKVDAVLVANPHVYHAEVALAALAAGKHVFVEKPMCLTLSEADSLARAEKRSDKVVQIGYMRRYAPAFLQAKDIVAELGNSIYFARVQDIIGRNAQFVEPTATVVRDLDLPDATRRDLAERTSAKFIEAIGTDSGDLKNSFGLLLGLSTHDISAMRDLLGRPKRVLHANHRSQGRVITAIFDYGDYVCEFVTGVDEIARFDAHLQVFAQKAVLRIEYDTPYIRNQPARLSVTRPDTEHGVAQTTSFPSRKDAFVIEWTVFHDAVTKAVAPKTTIADAREDLEIFLEIIDHLRGATERSEGGKSVM